jgi:NAD(P)-dependent dehydrogenase (short-subunit alcohol dehydrogenase family)
MRFFVTGGARGVGARIVADAVAAGHDVAFTYRDSQAQAQALVQDLTHASPGSRCVAHRLDVRDPAEVARVVQAVVDTFDGLDVAICNAGINRTGMAAYMSDEDWSAVIDTNLSGAFYVCREALPSLLAQRWGRLIMISSIGMWGTSGQVGYSASKAGLMGLAQGLAKEYGAKGITTNALVLGLFDTPMSRATMPERGVKFWRESCPAGRTGELSEVSSAALFLASRQAGFINGQMLGIDGGLSWVP